MNRRNLAHGRTLRQSRPAQPLPLPDARHLLTLPATFWLAALTSPDYLIGYEPSARRTEITATSYRPAGSLK